MNHRKLINDAWTYNANIRAEDGPQPPRGWSAVLHGVLISLGIIAALVLVAMLMSHYALAQAGSGRTTGSVKDTTGALTDRPTTTTRLWRRTTISRTGQQYPGQI